MPLIQHLRELRTRLLKAGIALALGTIVGFVFFDSVWEVLKEPFCNLPAPKGPAPGMAGVIGGSGGDGCSRPLVVHGIFESFFLRLRLAIAIGAILACPVWLYQLWAFVSPGLHTHERRYSFSFVGAGVPLFAGGTVLAYLVLSKGLAILLGFVPPGAVPLIGISEYFKYATVMLLVFGASFELPLLVTLLNLAGVLSHERLTTWRRWIVFGTCVFAALVTPQDPLSMVALALPLIVLMEAATLLAKVHDRRKARREAASGYATLGDDETSPLETDPAEAGATDAPDDDAGTDWRRR